MKPVFSDMYNEHVLKHGPCIVDDSLADKRRFFCVLLAQFTENEELVKRLELVKTAEELNLLCPEDPSCVFTEEYADQLSRVGNEMYEGHALQTPASYAEEDKRFEEMDAAEQVALMLIKSGFDRPELNDGVEPTSDADVRALFAAQAKVCARAILTKKRALDPFKTGDVEGLRINLPVSLYATVLAKRYPEKRSLLEVVLFDNKLINQGLSESSHRHIATLSLTPIINLPVYCSKWLSLIMARPFQPVLPAIVVLMRYIEFARMLMQSDIAETPEEREEYIQEKKAILTKHGIQNVDESNIEGQRKTKEEAFEILVEMRLHSLDLLYASFGDLVDLRGHRFFAEAEEMFRLYAVSVLRSYEFFFGLMMERYIPLDELAFLRTPADAPPKKAIPENIEAAVDEFNERASLIRKLSMKRAKGPKEFSVLDGRIPRYSTFSSKRSSPKPGSPLIRDIHQTLSFCIGSKGELTAEDWDLVASK